VRGAVQSGRAARAPSLESRLPGRRRTDGAASRRGRVLDAGARPGLGTAGAGASLRGGLRPARRPSFPASGALPSLAPRPRTPLQQPGPHTPRRRPAGSAAEVIELEGRSLRLTSLDRVLWPRTGFTKGDLIDYYLAAAPVLLPHLADGPLT